MTKRYNLDKSDGFDTKYLLGFRYEEKDFSKRNIGGGSLTVWGAISSIDCFELQLREKMFSNRTMSEFISGFVTNLLRFYSGGLALLT